MSGQYPGSNPQNPYAWFAAPPVTPNSPGSVSNAGGASAVGPTAFQPIVAPDRTWMAQEPLVFKRSASRSTWSKAMWVGGVFLSLLCPFVVGLIFLTNPESGFQAIRSSFDLVALVIMCVIPFGVIGAYVYCVKIRGNDRLVVDRMGFHLVEGRNRSDYAWPRSRSDLFICLSEPVAYGDDYISGSVKIHLLAPGYGDVPLIGVGYFNDYSRKAIVKAQLQLETLWAWGVARGVAVESGVYTGLVNPEGERRRRADFETVVRVLQGAAG
ncbi:hypothetical protein EHS14_03600 [Schaalia georgiae]|nr:hypothetical protein EHS14_03600 [Schaalia georgiae]